MGAIPKAHLSCEIYKQIMCKALELCSFNKTNKYKGKIIHFYHFLAQTLFILFIFIVKSVSDVPLFLTLIPSSFV